ncbi:MAG: GntR family transcriptional regulator [Christensenellaceae bacterium]|jgi:DNA-binding GntR family transcriptional regulator|nr:GntR family transcriptional regulator [Christensenellaceae bacterium]
MNLQQVAEELQPKSMTARDWVFQVIRSAIIRGMLPGNMQLKQDEISAALNVSHIPVREALRQLEAQGLVRIYSNRGAVVTKLSKKEMGDVMDVRILLELGALHAAIASITPQDILRAEQALHSLIASTDYYTSYKYNIELHFALYACCDNPALLSMIDQVHANTDRFLHPYFENERSEEFSSIIEHSKLIRACAEQDAGQAAAILRTHLENTKALLMASPLLG